MKISHLRKGPSGITFLALCLLTGVATQSISTAQAARALVPSAVTIAGSLQSELGCLGDWQPDCSATYLTYDSADDIWQQTWWIPAGYYEYKAALDNSWSENYGLNAQPGGANIPLSLYSPKSVKFYYDHKTHWVTDSSTSIIATVAGDFQSELGCGGDWDPGCLRSWLEDPAGSGTYHFETTGLPHGNYECKVTISESWTENYGADGIAGGSNIPFSVPFDNAQIVFQYDPVNHLLTITSDHSIFLPMMMK